MSEQKVDFQPIQKKDLINTQEVKANTLLLRQKSEFMTREARNALDNKTP